MSDIVPRYRHLGSAEELTLMMVPTRPAKLRPYDTAHTARTKLKTFLLDR